MPGEPQIAFAAAAPGAAPFEVRVNFGVFAGRAATPAEIDDLARRLLPEIGPVSIVSEERHEIGDAVEAVLQQVRIEVEQDRLGRGAGDVESRKRRIVDEAERWARECVADRQTPNV
jgi:hypothetical protein